MEATRIASIRLTALAFLVPAMSNAVLWSTEAYVVMFILAVANIDTPQVILTLIEPMAKANTFVAMLMLGLLFHIEFKKEYMGEIFKLIGIRHIFATVCAVIFYFVLLFDLVIRQTLV